MNKTIIYLSSLFLVLASSCSESESDPPNVYSGPYIVTLSGDSICLTTGALCSIDFYITATNNAPTGFSKDSSNYIIELRLADNNTTPIYYKLARVEPTNSHDNTSSTTKYRAFIEDLCLKKNYRDQVKIVLRHKTDGTTLPSSTFCIKYELDSLTESLLDTGLPLVVINTVNEEEPVCEYVSPPEGCWGSGITEATKVPGSIEIIQKSDVIYYSGKYDQDNSGMTIKIRGNTSAYYEKKPYKIKLQKKADLLNRGNDKVYSDKEWLLLCYDRLKALVGFKTNELMQMQWTPSFQFVNVMINGDYRGLYMLAESVKRNTECRLNVDKTGYIIEYDAYWWNEEVYFESKWTYPLNYTFKYPDDKDITKEQIDYIKSYIDNLEAIIKTGGEYQKYIDVDSWARWILAHDILGTLDSGGSNLFITKFDNTDSSKLMMANLWDFDSSYLQTDVWSNIHNSASLYSYDLFNNDNPILRNTYKKIWQDTHDVIFAKLSEFLSEFNESNTAFCLNKVIKYDNKRWNTSYPSVSEEIILAHSWFKSRHTFLNSNIPNI